MIQIPQEQYQSETESSLGVREAGGSWKRLPTGERIRIGVKRLTDHMRQALHGQFQRKA